MLKFANPEKVLEIVDRELDHMSEEDLREHYREIRMKELAGKNQNEIAAMWLEIMGYGLPDFYN